jgi:hypothetical protein
MRECGDCVECCISASVEEINKPMGVPCKNICDKGNDKPSISKMVVWLGLTDNGSYILWGSYRDGPPNKAMFEILMENSRLLPVAIVGEGKSLLYQDGRVVKDLSEDENGTDKYTM